MGQRSQEDYIARANRRAGLHTQGVKGLFILNGGATIALLTFLTQIIAGSTAALSLVKPIVPAICCFAFGLVVAAPINHLRYETSRRYDCEEGKPRGKLYGGISRGLFCLSLIAFVAGTFIAMRALWRAADHLQDTGAFTP